MKVSTVRDDSSVTKTSQVFEVSGPLLPHHTLNIALILHSLQLQNTSSLSFSTHTSTAAFNTRKVNDPAKDKMAEGWNKILVDASIANPGLLEKVKSSLSDIPTLHHGDCIKELSVRSDGYSLV